MKQWVLVNWLLIITALVALYGAALSTVSFLLNRREKKRRLRVTTSWGMLVRGQTLSREMLIVKAANSGHRSVTLSSISIRLPDQSHAFALAGITNPDLPCDLSDGRDCMAWLDPRELAAAMRQRGFAGVITICAVAKDALDVEHLSKSTRFDIERWLPDGEQT